MSSLEKRLLNNKGRALDQSINQSMNQSMSIGANSIDCRRRGDLPPLATSIIEGVGRPKAMRFPCGVGGVTAGVLIGQPYTQG